MSQVGQELDEVVVVVELLEVIVLVEDMAELMHVIRGVPWHVEELRDLPQE